THELVDPDEPGPLTETWPGNEPAAATLPDELYLVCRYPLELASNPDRRDPTEVGEPEHPDRRTPLDAIFPLIQEQRVVLATGSQLFSVTTTRPSRVEWSFESTSFGTSRPNPSLLLQPVVLTSNRDHFAVLFRTARDEANRHTSNHLFDVQRGRDQGLNRLFVFAQPQGEEPPSLVCDVGEILEESATVCGKPVLIGRRLYVPTFSGVADVELRVTAIDLDRRQRLWQRSLGTRRTTWMCAHDLRGLLPSVELTSYGGEILIGTSFGTLVRLGAETGDYRGVQFYPQYDELEHRVRSNTRPIFFGVLFVQLPAPRLRYPAKSPVIDTPRGPLWITLPPDSTNLIAMNLRTWTIEWRVPVERQTSLLGPLDGEIALLDVGVRCDGNTMSFRTVDTAGRHRRFFDLTLSVTSSPSPTGTADPEGPLLVGMPRRFGANLWVPTLAGIELFDLSDGAETRRVPRQVVAWPSGATGGTPYPLPGGGWLTVGRGDAGRGTLSYLEIYSEP
ncbi:MAG: hypothetical protein KDC38_20130, partial [Planctomycetes bacterium]|nr:hypothetical protein [Planctomycetota bacterium]